LGFRAAFKIVLLIPGPRSTKRFYLAYLTIDCKYLR